MLLELVETVDLLVAVVAEQLKLVVLEQPDRSSLKSTTFNCIDIMVED
jgi:hypothetical protein